MATEAVGIDGEGSAGRVGESAVEPVLEARLGFK